MKPIFAVSSLALAVSLAGGCAPAAPPPPDTAAMIAAATALDEQFEAAFNAGDAAALNALYWNSPEAVSLGPDTMVSRGIEGIRTGNDAAIPALHDAGAVLQLTESHHIVVGDAVVTWGLWTMTMNGPDGAPMEMQGRFTDVKAERDGKWVYLVDHASVPLPPPPGGGNTD
jgi:ketosteroid isomerase-like protein